MLSKPEIWSRQICRWTQKRKWTAKKLSPVLKTGQLQGEKWTSGSKELKKTIALQFSDGQTKDYKIPSGAVWTQWLSASVSQYKITVEDAMKKKRKDRKEQLGRKCYRACVLSCLVTGWGERKDEAGVNRDRVNRKQALGFHLNLREKKKPKTTNL